MRKEHKKLKATIPSFCACSTQEAWLWQFAIYNTVVQICGGGVGICWVAAQFLWRFIHYGATQPTIVMIQNFPKLLGLTKVLDNVHSCKQVPAQITSIRFLWIWSLSTYVERKLQAENKLNAWLYHYQSIHLSSYLFSI